MNKDSTRNGFNHLKIRLWLEIFTQSYASKKRSGSYIDFHLIDFSKHRKHFP